MATTIKTPEEMVEDNTDGYSEDTVELAMDILEVWNPSKSGKAPSGIAATAVYVACMFTDDTATQAGLKDEFGTCETTIRKHKDDALQTIRSQGVL